MFFNALHAVFLEIFGYIHTDIHTDIQRNTYIQKVSFYNINIEDESRRGRESNTGVIYDPTVANKDW